MALFHLGTSKEIANVDTEQSQEAATMRVFWDLAREKILGEFPWPFATEILALGLIEEDPNDEWTYSYTYPSDALTIRKFQSGIRKDSRSSVIPYRVASDEDTKIIYVDLEEAVCEYTRNVTSTALFPAEFCLALSYLLASFSAYKLTKTGSSQLSKDMLLLYKISLAEAKSKALNEEQSDIEPEAEMIRGRE